MSKNIPGVPESITREQYKALFEAAGIEPRNTIELTFCADGIYALVMARDEHGDRVVDPVKGPMNHTIYIPVED